jgi:integrase
MPRPRKPARLWQRSDGAWIILDGGRHIRTGHSGSSGERAAQDALARYLLTRIPDTIGPRQPADVTVGEVLALYAKDHAHLAGRETLAYCILALAGFWDGACDTVKGSTCRAYARHRAEPVTRSYTGKRGGQWTRTVSAGPGKVRRELGVLAAALHYAVKEGVLVHAPEVTLPPAPPPKDRWLTRAEVAKILRASAPHLRRFIVISIYTGTRESAVLGLRLEPSLTSGWIDHRAGILHRKGARETESNKRRGSVRMPPQLVAHASRWARMGGSHAVMWQGSPVAEIDTAFRAACRRAGIEDVAVHDLKRTAVTWAFQRGMSREDAAEYFDTSARTLERVYRAHSPLYQSRAAEIMGRRS